MPKYSNDYKRKVVSYYKEYGQAATVRKYKHDYYTLDRWTRKIEVGLLDRKERQVLTKEEKYEILKYFRLHGYRNTEETFNINRGTINNWDRLYYEYGIDGLDSTNGRPSREKKDVNTNDDLLKEHHELKLKYEVLKKRIALDQEKELKQMKKKR